MKYHLLRHMAWYAIRCHCCVQSSHHAAYHICPRAGAEQLLPRSWLLVYSSWSHQSGIQRSLVAFPFWAIAHRAPAVSPRLLAGSERLQCTSPGHHAAPGSRLQRLQRRWRSFWWLSRNKLRWQGPTHAPPPAGHSRAGQSTSCPSHFASAATHNTSQAALHWRK